MNLMTLNVGVWWNSTRLLDFQHHFNFNMSLHLTILGIWDYTQNPNYPQSSHKSGFGFVSGMINAYPYHPWGTGICTYIYHKNQPNVGNIAYMDGMVMD